MDLGFIAFSLIWVVIIRHSSWPDYVQYRNYFYITGAFVLIFLPKIVFLVFNVVHDAVLFFRWLAIRLFQKQIFEKKPAFPPLLLIAGFILSVFMFAWVLYGVAYGRFHFQVKEVKVEVPQLPEAFEGFRIVHISDTHFGSFVRKRPVARGVSKIMQNDYDMLVFTGDMINNEAVEAQKFVEIFQALDPPYGMFSVLGNHDMGDYRRWHTIQEKKANLQHLKDIQSEMGFTLLRNEHRFIHIDQDSIMIAGVDNWGLPPFSQYGDLEAALGANAHFPYVVLLSHDPSHWTEQVVPLTDVMLTLSGHTHGMQAGINLGSFQWSPVSAKYSRWGGLYQIADQFLYVNRGFGFIGFPGRIGMRPEITIIELVVE